MEPKLLVGLMSVGIMSEIHAANEDNSLDTHVDYRYEIWH